MNHPVLDLLREAKPGNWRVEFIHTGKQWQVYLDTQLLAEHKGLTTAVRRALSDFRTWEDG